MLAAIRAALGPDPAIPELSRAYRRAGTCGPAGAPELVERFCERVADYCAVVERCGSAELASAIATACSRRGTVRLTAAPGAVLRIPGVEVAVDDPATPPQLLDNTGGALTGCALAIAETGTLVLDGDTASGRRALTLVPDHHVCVVRAEQIVADVPDAIAAIAAAAHAPRPITFVSGPSATSDIGFERVEGVHGPRQLDVIVVDS